MVTLEQVMDTGNAQYAPALDDIKEIVSADRAYAKLITKIGNLNHPDREVVEGFENIQTLMAAEGEKTLAEAQGMIDQRYIRHIVADIIENIYGVRRQARDGEAEDNQGLLNGSITVLEYNQRDIQRERAMRDMKNKANEPYLGWSNEVITDISRITGWRTSEVLEQIKAYSAMQPQQTAVAPPTPTPEATEQPAQAEVATPEAQETDQPAPLRVEEPVQPTVTVPPQPNVEEPDQPTVTTNQPGAEDTTPEVAADGIDTTGETNPTEEEAAT